MQEVARITHPQVALAPRRIRVDDRVVALLVVTAIAMAPLVAELRGVQRTASTAARSWAHRVLSHLPPRRLVAVALVAVVALVGRATASAQVRSLPLPREAASLDPVRDPAGGFVVAHGGTVFHSTRSRRGWVVVARRTRIRALIDTSADGALWAAGVDLRTLFRSTTRGRSWVRVGRTRPANRFGGALSVEGAPIMPGPRGVVLAREVGSNGTRCLTPDGVATRLARSTDRGRSWSMVLDLGGAGSVQDVAFDPADPSRAVALVIAPRSGGDVCAEVGMASRLYESRDAGATWRAIGRAVSGDAMGLVIDPGDSDHIAIGLPGRPGVRVSADGGASWRSLGDGASGLAFLPGGALVGVDFGDSWRATRDGPALPISQLRGVSLGTVVVDGPDTLVSGDLLPGALRSSDGARTFHDAGRAPYTQTLAAAIWPAAMRDDGVLLVPLAGGGLARADRQRVRRERGVPRRVVIFGVASSGGHDLVALSDGRLRLRDRDGAWRRTAAAAPVIGALAAIDPSGARLAVADFARLATSADRGRSWHRLHPPLAREELIEALAITRSRVWIATSNGRLLAYHAGRWTQRLAARTLTTTFGQDTLSVDPRDDASAVIARSDGVWRVTDTATRVLPEDALVLSVARLATDPDVLVTGPDPLLLSTDAGRTWTPAGRISRRPSIWPIYVRSDGAALDAVTVSPDLTHVLALPLPAASR